ncbi:MAG: hypothetical protein ACTS73_07115 [Arsenophonus sp. NEOnobi-MAG3]
MPVIHSNYFPQQTIQTGIAMLKLKYLKSEIAEKHHMLQQLVPTPLSKACKKRRRVVVPCLYLPPPHYKVSPK